MGIAVKTYLDDANPTDTPEVRERKISEFPPKFLPYATNFAEDLDTCFRFFDALAQGVQMLESELPAADKAVWTKASEYLDQRR